jgi:hypothetical protein
VAASTERAPGIPLSVSSPLAINQRVAKLGRDGGAYVAQGKTHAFRVETDGSWSLRPMIDPKGHKAAGTSLTLGRSAIERGGAHATLAKLRDGDKPTEVAIDRGLAVERIIYGRHSVEQTWTFATKPVDPAEGSAMRLPLADLVVRVPATGHQFVSESADGLVFRDPATKTLMRYGAATWIDAAGEKTFVHPRWVRGEIVLNVPSVVVEHSKYPAVLDPTLGAQIPVDATGAAADGFVASVAYSATADEYAIAWMDNDPSGPTTTWWVQLISGAGALIGTNIAVPETAGGDPKVGFDGTNFLIAWSEAGPPSVVRTIRMSTGGAFVGGAVTQVTDAINNLGVASIGTNSTGVSLITYFVAPPGPGAFLTNAIEVTSGALVGSAVNINTNNSFFDPFSSVASDGTDFLVTSCTDTSPQAIVGNIVTASTRAVGAPIAVSPAFGFSSHVAFGGGTYMVVYEASPFGRIEAGRVTPVTGATPDFGAPIAVYDPGDTFDTISPVVAYNGTNFVSAFSHFTSTTDQVIRSQMLAPSGALHGGLFTAGWPSAGPGLNFALAPDPSMAAVGGGNSKTLVVYTDEASQKVRANIFTGTGADGSGCVDNAECDHNHCVSGICCNTACASTTCAPQTCATGTCTPVAHGSCAPATCTLAAASCPVADLDGDGLSDAWETSDDGTPSHNHYVDLNCNGVFDPNEPLLPGASVSTKDLYVQYDYMQTATHTHQPPPAVLNQVQIAYAKHGISLHWIAPAGPITEHQVTTRDAAPTAACVGADFVTMHTLRAAAFAPIASALGPTLAHPAYHYLVFGHNSTLPDTALDGNACPIDPECGAHPDPTNSGSSDITGDDIIVALGYNIDLSIPIGIETFAGTTLHEIGHNMGLKHGSLAAPAPSPAPRTATAPRVRAACRAPATAPTTRPRTPATASTTRTTPSSRSTRTTSASRRASARRSAIRTSSCSAPPARAARSRPRPLAASTGTATAPRPRPASSSRSKAPPGCFCRRPPTGTSSHSGSSARPAGAPALLEMFLRPAPTRWASPPRSPTTTPTRPSRCRSTSVPAAARTGSSPAAAAASRSRSSARRPSRSRR